MQIFFGLFSIIPILQANDWELLEGRSRDGLGWRADLWQGLAGSYRRPYFFSRDTLYIFGIGKYVQYKERSTCIRGSRDKLGAPTGNKAAGNHNEVYDAALIGWLVKMNVFVVAPLEPPPKP